jgi:hypothetical protein
VNGSQVDVIGQLPELKWRSLVPVPVEDASYDFSHDQVERRYPYVDGAGHDHTGRGPIKFTARLLFINTLQEDLYPHTWQDWRAALFDGSAGDLVHPELGTVRARVIGGSVKITAHSRAGVAVEVTWIETLDNPDKAPADFAALSISLQAAAEAAETACSALGIAYPKVKNPSTGSVPEAIKRIEGQLFSADPRVVGAIDQVVGGIRQMQDAVAAAETSTNHLRSRLHTWPALWALQLVEQGLLELVDRAQKSARPVTLFMLDRSTTLDAFARTVGNTVAEVVELNPTALGKPSIPAGVTLRFYTGT